MSQPTGQWGGYRRPANPAPVSGPGANSRRTDGGPGQPVRVAPGGDYGERQEMEALQQSAPLARAAGSTPAPPVSPEQVLSSITGLGAPSANPDEPVTAGAGAGPGPGPEVLGLPQDIGSMKRADARRLYESGAVQAMILAAQREDATPSFRRYVRKVIASL